MYAKMVEGVASQSENRSLQDSVFDQIFVNVLGLDMHGHSQRTIELS